jgi:hypothetical protein
MLYKILSVIRFKKDDPLHGYYFVRHKEGRRLRLQVLDEDRLSKDDLIGEDKPVKMKLHTVIRFVSTSAKFGTCIVS